jgi:hypothetical protein
VPNLKKFKYDKATSRIVHEKIRKVSVTGGNPISFLTQTPVTENISKDPISIASIGSDFTKTT